MKGQTQLRFQLLLARDQTINVNNMVKQANNNLFSAFRVVKTSEAKRPRWLMLKVLLMAVTSISVCAQNITRVEYFIDSDPGFGSGVDVPITPAAQINNFTFNVSVASVTDGFHTLFVRSRDANNRWSIVQGRPFVKLAPPVTTLANLNRIEYYIDTDPGFGAGTNVPFAAGTQVSDLAFNVPLAAVADGFHTLFVRSRDANNRWSIIQSRPFLKIAAPATAANLNRIEYFIDTDPGFGLGVAVPFTAAASVSNLVFDVNTASLTEGPHRIFVRSRDANNRWSIIQIRDFTVCNAATTTAAAATAITTTGFTANWSAVPNVANYRIDVSQDDFVTFVTGNNDRLVNATTVNVTGLQSGRTYKYRVRAVGATCTSVNSNNVSVTLPGIAPSAPVAIAATNITETSFQANWNAVTNATSYQLDVSLDQNFTSLLASYTSKTVTGTNDLVTGLTSGTPYFYRVRALNGNTVSGNSPVISVTTAGQRATASPGPSGLTATFVSNTGVLLSWDALPNVTQYRIDVSADNFVTFAPGWNSSLISFEQAPSGRTNWSILGLAPNTSYKVRMRAVIPDGVTQNSVDIAFTTDLHPPMVSPNTWVNAIGIQNNETFVNGMASDPDGNIYAVGKFGGTISVGGVSLTTKGGTDVFVIKYNPAGTVLWAKSFGGTAFDEGWQVAVDATGVYVSGAYSSTVDFNPDAGVLEIPTRGAAKNPHINIVDDGFLAKFSLQTGAMLWAQSLGDAWPEYYSRGMVTDWYNGVILTGTFSGTNDFDGSANTSNLTAVGGADAFIARFDGGNGALQWARGMGSTNFDAGTSLLADGDNLYAAGWYYGNIDLDPGAGVVSATGSGSYLSRFSLPNGNLVTAKSLPNQGSYAEVYDIAKDLTGLYVVGTFAGSADLDPDAGVSLIEGRGGFVARYALNNLSLTWRTALQATNFMSPSRVIADGSGLYVGGTFAWIADFDPGPGQANRSGAGDIFLARYNSADGGFVWAKSIGSSGTERIRSSMTLTSDGLFVGGSFQGTVNFDPYTNTSNRIAQGVVDGFIARYQSVSPPAPAAPTLFAPPFVSNTGALLRWTGPNDVTDYRVDLSVNSDFSNAVLFNYLAKFPSASAGTRGWNLESLSPSTTYYVRVRAESVGGVVSAYSNVISFTTNPHPVQVSPNLLTLTPGTASDEQVTALATDASNNLYAVGRYTAPITFGTVQLTHAGQNDAFFVKYNPSGVVQWAKSLSSAAEEEIWGVTTDATGVYVYGSFAGSLDVDPNAGTTTLTSRGTFVNGTRDDGFLAKYSLADGSLIWAVSLGDAYPITGSPLVSDGSFVYLTGSFFGENDFDPGAATNSRTAVGDADVFLARYAASNGTYGWAVAFGSTSADQGYSVLLDGANIFACGFVRGDTDLDPGVGQSAASSGAYFSKFTASTGALHWARNIVDNSGVAFDITKDATSLYVIGQYNSNATDADPGPGVFALGDGTAFLTRYTLTDGTFLNAASFRSSNFITPRKVIADASGVYMAGSSTFQVDFDGSSSEANRTSVFQDAFLARYSSDCSFVWAKTFGGYGTDAIRGGLALAADGIYIGGSYEQTANFDPYLSTIERTASGGLDIFIAKYQLTATAPAAVTATAATSVTQTSFVANWNQLTAVNSYRIDVSTSNTFTSFVTNFQNRSVNNSGFQVTGLAPSTTYYYRVRAINAAGTSANSNVITVVTPAATLGVPTAAAATSVAATSFVANWSAVAGATGYQLDVTTDNFASFVQGYQGRPVTSTSETVSGLLVSTSYQYRVRAVTATTSSTNSNVIGVTTAAAIPSTPVAIAATAISTTGFTANWNAATNATSYRLDISTDNFITFITGYNGKIVNTTSDVVSGLTAGVTYQYRLRAVNAGGTSVNSNTISVVTLLPVPLAPVATAATAASETGFTANWNAVTGATSYLLDVSSDNFVTFISGYNGKTVTNTFDAIGGLTSNSAFSYRVRAVNSGGTSGNSNVISASTIPAPPVANGATAVSSSGFTANWAAVTGATAYLLDVSTDNFVTFVSGYQLKSVTATSEVLTGLSQNTLYSYRVRVTTNRGTSFPSASIQVTTPVASPVATAATNVTATSFTANWNAVPAASSYRLDISADNFVTFVSGYSNKVVAGTTDPVTNLTANTAYKYRVRALIGTSTSANSNVIDVTTATLLPSAPVASAATSITSGGFTANWSSVTGATGYQLDVSTDNFITFITGYNSKPVTGTTETLTGLVSATAYKYRVRAVNAAGASINSNVIDVITLPSSPTANAAQSVTTSSFTASWSTVEGATGYQLDVSLDDFVTFLAGYNGRLVNATSEVIEGLTPSTLYRYRVRSVNVSGASVNSNVIEVTTSAPGPNAPVAQAATSVTSNGFTANWTAVTGVTGYELDVSADGFSTFVAGYNSKVVGQASDAVTGLTAATSYQYRVRAVSSTGKSPNSNIVSITTGAAGTTAPSAPQATTATNITVNSFQANWNAVTGATGYLLDVSTDNFATFVGGYEGKVIGATNSEVVSALFQGVGYQYRVRATNAGGVSGNSNVILVSTNTILKTDQTITFAALPVRTMGEPAFTVTATATSGLAVSFITNSDKITIQGSTVTIVRPGRATITALQPGNATFNAAPDVSREFCIRPAKPAITITGNDTENPTLTSSALTGNVWYRDNQIISGATGQTLVATSQGIYKVRAIVEGCESEFSNDFPLIITGESASQSAAEFMSVTPNPANDYFTVKFRDNAPKIIEVVTAVGVVKATRQSQKDEERFDVADYPTGFYYIKVRSASKNYSSKLLKK